MIQIDSTALRELDSLIVLNMAEQDSLLNLLVDSLLTDTAAMAVPADSIDSLAAPRDSIYRLLKGFRNVKIYRSDFQTVCDSMTAISTDSTIHLYIDPVLWNENNQITSDVMDIFTENQQLTRAEFIGSPMMVSQLDTTHYNQVAGKTMTAYFYNNQIYRNDVNGNAQTIYYMQDGEPVEITMMGVIESGEISFLSKTSRWCRSPTAAIRSIISTRWTRFRRRRISVSRDSSGRGRGGLRRPRSSTAGYVLRSASGVRR